MSRDILVAFGRKTLAITFLLSLFTFAILTSKAYGSSPTITTCSSGGIVKLTFYASETMYVKGSGYPSFKFSPSDVSEGSDNDSLATSFGNAMNVAGGLFGSNGPPSYAIYVVKSQTNWTDKMVIPQRVPGTAQKVYSDPFTGDISPTPVWNSSLVPGGYDIIVDINNNGRYDVGIDVLDWARINPCPVQHYGTLVLVVPEYWLGTIFGLTSFFGAIGVFRLSKNRRARARDKVT